jgi:hypothetical protein
MEPPEVLNLKTKNALLAEQQMKWLSRMQSNVLVCYFDCSV